jgi:hypothetical protein
MTKYVAHRQSKAKDAAVGQLSPETVLHYLQSYSAIEKLMQSSRINPRLYPHLGGLLIYNNVKMTKIAKDVRVAKKSIRRVFRVQSPYTQAISQVYILNDNKQVTEREVTLT